MLKLKIDSLFQEREVEIRAVHQEFGEHDLRDPYFLIFVFDIAEFKQSLRDFKLLIVREVERGKEVDEFFVGHVVILLEHQVDKANFLNDVDLQESIVSDDALNETGEKYGLLFFDQFVELLIYYLLFCQVILTDLSYCLGLFLVDSLI